MHHYIMWKMRLKPTVPRHTVKNCILDAFAGPPKEGVFSPSAQNTLYIAQKSILDRVPQMSHIEVELPNKHYVAVDFTKLSSLTGEQNDEVFLPFDSPAGNIRAVL